jgi:hypothetical protein
MSHPKFPVGEFMVTPGARDNVPEAEMMNALARHESGNWGRMNPKDRRANERALVDGARLLSVYRTKSGVKFWILTSGDRAVTTVLLPQED